MPYIKQEDRPKFQEDMNALVELAESNEIFKTDLIETVVYSIVDRWYDHKSSYQTINDICGVLRCVLLEYKRRNGETWFDNEGPTLLFFMDLDTLPISNENCQRLINRRDKLDVFDENIESLTNKLSENNYSVGEVNYVLSSMLERIKDDVDSADFENCVVQIENWFYVRCATPYELLKIEENGDI